ncbi:hypothetical protein [Lysobacter olei]
MPHAPLRTAALVAATCLLAQPAASQTSKGPKTQVWMDVATHSMAGMPELDGLAGAAMGALGGQGMGNHYGAARHGAMPGRFVDISLWNGAAPGKDAEQHIPAGLRLGERLPLLPPVATPRAPTQPGGKPQDHQSRILVYWGCGTEVRAGQPRVITVSSKDGQVQVSGSLQGRYAPDRSPDVGPAYALWPNDRDKRSVPQGASLVGSHRLTGPQIPESLRFDLQQAQDFMPTIALSSSGSFAGGFNLGWQPVARARGYFLHAMGVSGDAMVLWSSAESADAGMGMFDYLPEATVDKWVREKVLLGTDRTSCALPKGIFGQGDDAGAMLRMIAYGPETTLTYPPRPAGKAPWTPEWSVRVRTKSTAFAPLGMDIATHDEANRTDQPQDKKKQMKRLLRGLLGGG